MITSFITWYPSCRRSDALSEWLGADSHFIHYLEFKQPLYAPLKYMLQTFSTLRRLWQDKPDLILVASPPVFAVLVVWIYSKVFGVRYVIDAHTGVFDDPRWSWILPLSRSLSRQAVATIVTNEFLKKQVESWGAQAIIIGDLPVKFPSVKAADLGPGFHVVVINTFSQDEPLDEVLLAARKVPEVQFHITGDPRHSRNNWSNEVPSNAHFTSWLSDKDYASLLRSAHVVMSLTTHDHTMQRGGYEAMALEKPLITSSWDLLRKTFYRGTIHVENTADQIAAAIAQTQQDHPTLVGGMRRLRQERLCIFGEQIEAFQSMIVQGSLEP